MKFEFSAGGVVYKKENNITYILLAKHSGHHGWVFPKGIIGDKIQNEKKDATAIREVREETGAEAQILENLSPVTYWFQMDGEKIKKTVYYFLMKYIKGDITKHDFEMEEVKWVSSDDVEKTLTFRSDKKVWQEAKSKLK